MELWKTHFLQLRSGQVHPSFLPGENFFYFTGAITPSFGYSAIPIGPARSCLAMADGESQPYLVSIHKFILGTN